MESVLKETRNQVGLFIASAQVVTKHIKHFIRQTEVTILITNRELGPGTKLPKGIWVPG